MSNRCSYLFCNSKKESSTKLSHHKFPSDPELLQKWVDAMGLENYVPRGHHKLCSEHFEPSMFWGGLQRNRLRQDAVPTLFEAPFKRAKGGHCGPGQKDERPFAHLWLPQPELQGKTSTAAGPSDTAAAIVDSGAPQERASPEPQDVETQVDAACALKLHSYSYSSRRSPLHRRPLIANKAMRGVSGHRQQPFILVESVPCPDQDDTGGMDSPEALLSSYPMDVAATPPSESVEAREHPVSSVGQDDEDIAISEVSPGSPYTSDVADTSSNGSVARESSDRSREDTPEKEFLRGEVRRYAAISIASRKKIKALQESERRLRRKVVELKAIIAELELQRYHDNGT
ncbi:uncharacterized protein LOC144158183 isoform X1 [Haemaphysalis longicornis]